MVDLCDLPADELLKRTSAPSVDAALAVCANADVLIVATPVYRAAYSGLLKIFFDLFQPDALARVVAVPIATGASPAHQLVLDHALRPLLSSVGALVIPNGVYAVDAQFRPDGIDQSVIQQLDRAVSTAVALAARR